MGFFDYNVNLLPCKHCGCDEVRLMRGLSDKGIIWYVECRDCGIRTNDYEEDVIAGECDEVSAGMKDAIDCAVASWNRCPPAYRTKGKHNNEVLTEDERKGIYDLFERMKELEKKGKKHD